jgi:hypothetical protein
MPAGAPPEHVIPKWFVKFRPKRAVFRHTERPEIRGDIERPPWRPDFSSKKFELTADTICPRCNHGWMSDLESESSELLTRMIEGKPQGLSIEQQVLVSRWVAKTVLTWDQSQPSDRRFLPLDCCRWLNDNQLPPAGSRIRLARYEGESGEFVQMIYDALYTQVPSDPIAPGPPKAHRAAIRIGHLVAEFTVAEVAVLRETGDIASLLITTWPSVEVRSWPPRVAMTDEIWTRFVGPDKLPA